MSELLAPAGGMEALIAAVQNGADAVYLGARLFNARRGADKIRINPGNIGGPEKVAAVAVASSDQDPATAAPPLVTVAPLIGFTGVEKLTDTTASVATPVAPAAGDRDTTVGAAGPVWKTRSTP